MYAEVEAILVHGAMETLMKALARSMPADQLARCAWQWSLAVPPSWGPCCRKGVAVRSGS